MDFRDQNDTVLIHDAQRAVWLLFTRPVRVLQTDRPDNVLKILAEVDEAVTGKGLHAAGFVAYEAAPAFDSALKTKKSDGFPLIWFGIYGAPEIVDGPEAPAAPGKSISWKPSIERETYSSSIFNIKERLHKGDTYQVNYTFRMYTPSLRNPWDLFSRMLHSQGGRYGAYLNLKDWMICSASPELFFQLDGDELVSKPMKGTMKRGLWNENDLRQAVRLGHCEKNRAENLMIVDMVRNDLGRIAKPGSVYVPTIFEVEKYPAMWQLTSTVCGNTTAGLQEIFTALFPPASITGAPKAKTMEIIHDLENTPRRVYTGAIGYFSPGRKAQFNVAIRTLLIDKLNDTAEFGVGGGIVWDSVESAEFEECKTKASILSRSMPEFSLLETMSWKPKTGYVLLEKHLDRLTESAAYFDRTVDMDALRDKLSTLSLHMLEKPHRIRIIVPPSGEPVIETKIMSAPSGKPYRVCLAKTPVKTDNIFLYHKTTNRTVYEDALKECPGYDDVILFNEENEITESCIANVLVEIEGRLYTPPVHSGLLNGTYRSFLLDQGKVQEKIIRLKDLHLCTKIYLVNSVRGMWEISLDLEERLCASGVH